MLVERRVGDKRTCVLYTVSNSPTIIIIITASPDAEVFFRRCSLNFGCPVGTVQPALRRNAQGPPIEAKEKEKDNNREPRYACPVSFQISSKAGRSCQPSTSLAFESC